MYTYRYLSFSCQLQLSLAYNVVIRCEMSKSYAQNDEREKLNKVAPYQASNGSMLVDISGTIAAIKFQSKFHGRFWWRVKESGKKNMTIPYHDSRSIQKLFLLQKNFNMIVLVSVTDSCAKSPRLWINCGSAKALYKT